MEGKVSLEQAYTKVKNGVLIHETGLEPDEYVFLLSYALFYLSESDTISTLELMPNPSKHFIKEVYGHNAEKIILFLKEKGAITSKVLTEILSEEVYELVGIKTFAFFNDHKSDFYKRIVKDGAEIPEKLKKRLETTMNEIDDQIENLKKQSSLIEALLK